jgi:hypothetical protein
LLERNRALFEADRKYENASVEARPEPREWRTLSSRLRAPCRISAVAGALIQG